MFGYDGLYDQLDGLPRNSTELFPTHNKYDLDGVREWNDDGHNYLRVRRFCCLLRVQSSLTFVR